MSPEGSPSSEVEGATKPQVAPELEESKEDECGYTYDHDPIDMGDGGWTCRRCGAEGWDEEDET